MGFDTTPPPSPIAGLEVFDYDEHHVTASWFNMVFAFWNKDTRLPAFRLVGSKLAELATMHREGVGVCQVVGLLATPPEADVRSEINALIKDGLKGRLKHYSVVHEGSGFKAASVRAIISASQMMTRSKTNLAVFSKIGEAALWHAEQQRAIGRNTQSGQVTEIVMWLRDIYSEPARALGR